MNSSPDVIIIDPPRSGCSLQTLESLGRLSPKMIVYVSCDPWTLARDTKILCNRGFALDEIQPVDLFPQTHHVESIAIFSFQHNDLPFILASQSPRRRVLLDGMGDGLLISSNENVDVEKMNKISFCILVVKKRIGYHQQLL